MKALVVLADLFLGKPAYQMRAQLQISSRWYLIPMLLLTLMLSACSLNIIRRGDLDDLRPDARLVMGRINYIIDGEIKTPYGLFKPKWPAPFISAVQLESGEVFSSPAVADEDGSFLWQMPPGHYVITRIGFGTFTDDTYIAWPRVAFAVPQSGGLYYLGHLQLAGASPPAASRSSVIQYRYIVADEFVEQVGNHHKAVKTLMLQDAQMPIGDTLAELWEQDSRLLIRQIFGNAPER